MRSHTRITRSMSCSTSRIAVPLGPARRIRSPSASRLVVVEPGPDLVEQQQPGPGGERPAQLDQPGQPGRHRVDAFVATGASPTRSHDLAGHLPRVCVSSSDQRRWNSAAARMLSKAVSDPKTSSRWNVRAMPQPRPLVGREPADVASADPDAARRRLLQARDDVEQRRLPRAVGADQAGDLPAPGGEVDVGQRLARRRSAPRRRRPRAPRAVPCVASPGGRRELSDGADKAPSSSRNSGRVVPCAGDGGPHGGRRRARRSRAAGRPAGRSGRRTRSGPGPTLTAASPVSRYWLLQDAGQVRQERGEQREDERAEQHTGGGVDAADAGQQQHDQADQSMKLLRVDLRSRRRTGRPPSPAHARRRAVNDDQLGPVDVDAERRARRGRVVERDEAPAEGLRRSASTPMAAAANTTAQTDQERPVGLRWGCRGCAAADRRCHHRCRTPG